MKQATVDPRMQFERGIVILSFDIEQICGYFDLMSEAQFETRYPAAIEAHSKLLTSLVKARVPATWFLVGGMTLGESGGADDFRMAGLPLEWCARIPAGSEPANPLWYRRSFVERLRS